MILCGLSDGSNTAQAACFSPRDDEQLLAHNYVVIHCYLEGKTRPDSEGFLFSLSFCAPRADSLTFHCRAIGFPYFLFFRESSLFQSNGTRFPLHLECI